VEIKNVVTVLGFRMPNIFIDAQSFTGSDPVIRGALIFEIEQLSQTMAAMMNDGEPAEDRIPYIEKRRDALAVLELMDGVSPTTDATVASKVPMTINNFPLSQEQVDVTRQALVSWKRFKARDKNIVGMLDMMTNYMLYGQAETKRRAAEANAS
jgi:hypothetical protein